ncbi:hypothetical protein GR160_04260 [Flavobacterium sp. Sd200]|uniref:hypothetical protein n=1 Tax=Flavobacterium sp. Sd200 TaxID=2692211 RepID=UPI00136BEEAF|nr:hypothetical protein [Flavobacterium sp. Sd200]MXN90431.1 hypothetical protein [Flavobacterium sp. Sd200]
MKLLTTADIDRLNIGLMLLSAVAAFIFPFELFLFVYAFLGPLHYLTEINWLHKKHYFTTHKYDYAVIVFFVLLISLLYLTHSTYRSYVSLLTFIIFGVCFAMAFFKEGKQKIIFAFCCGLVGIGLYYFFHKNFRIVFATLLPTIVHVFIFTGLFILLGALKSKSWVGIASVVVFTLCAIATLFIPTGIFIEPVSQYIHDSHSSFKSLNRTLIGFLDILHTNEIRNDLQIPTYITEREIPIYLSSTGISIMRFVAFAYTYHYLNWFSKTSVIQWHNTKKVNLFLILTIWIGSIFLYVYDYRTGLRWLYVLSLGHVLLEFPLNHRSIIDIKNQFTKKVSV